MFHDVAYKAKNREDLLSGVDEFLDAVTILPPGAWDPSIRIEPPNQLPSQEARKKHDPNLEPKHEDSEDEEERERAATGLKRTGRLVCRQVCMVERLSQCYHLLGSLEAFATMSNANFPGIGPISEMP